MRYFKPPPFAMPLPEYGYGQPPVLAAVERDMWAWIESYDLPVNLSMREHLARTRPEYLTALYYPYADAPHLAALNHYMTLAFLIDDLLDDAISENDESAVAEFTADLADVARGEREPSHPVARALDGVLGELAQDRSPQWRSLLNEANERWLDTYSVEARTSGEGRAMRFGEYVVHRRHGVDMMVFLHLEEYAHDIELPAEVRDLPAMVQAREHVCDWAGLYNDVFSAEKEEAVGYPYNGVLIVREQRGCSTREAAEVVGDALTGLIGQFEAAGEAVRAQVRAATDDDPAVLRAALRVVDGYRHCLRGNFDYHLSAARYDRAPSYLLPAQDDGLRPLWSPAHALRGGLG
ncbi:terpene synthase family protein [Streptomyces pathocidini]|uniref:terpene synthase family protein n=1 Tax=Streptomyces pathocidini TaxID=1650571 RepID=UPI0033EFF661